jgi:DNA-binding MarR family transcriptional regulator
MIWRMALRTPTADSAPPNPALAHEVWALLQQFLAGQRRTRFAQVAADTGLSLPQSFALQQLNPEGRPESMRALAQCLQVDPSAITGLVDRLEAKGLVERRPDPDDRRVKALVLTPRGKRVRAHLRRILDEPPASLSRVDERRLRVVREVLAAMAAAEATE